MLLLQGQLQVKETDLEKLRSFGDFVAIFYSSFWFQSPLASEAAYNDLMCYKTMLKYQSSSKLGNIAHNAAKALSRHLWCLTEELISFALCSKQLACEEKEVLARRMLQLYRENQHAVLAPQKPVLPTSQRQHGFQIWREDVLCFCSSGFESPSMISSFCVGLKANGASLIHAKGLND